MEKTYPVASFAVIEGMGGSECCGNNVAAQREVGIRGANVGERLAASQGCCHCRNLTLNQLGGIGWTWWDVGIGCGEIAGSGKFAGACGGEVGGEVNARSDCFKTSPRERRGKRRVGDAVVCGGKLDEVVVTSLLLVRFVLAAVEPLRLAWIGVHFSTQALPTHEKKR